MPAVHMCSVRGLEDAGPWRAFLARLVPLRLTRAKASP